MKPSPGTLAFGLLLSVAVPASAAFAADAGEQLMLERANYWRSQQRLDIAENILRKLLAFNPSQPDALYQRGMLARAQGNRVEAEQYFNRLRLLAATDRHAAELAAGLASSGSPRVLTSAAPVAATAVAMTTAADKPAPVVAGICDEPPATATNTPSAPAMVVASADSDDLLPAVATAPAGARPRRAGAAAADSDDPIPAPPTALANAPGSPTLSALAGAADSDDLIPGAPTAPADVPRRRTPRPAMVAVIPGQPRAQRVAASQTVSDANTATIPPIPAAARSAGSADLGDAARAVQVAQVELQAPPPVNGYQQNIPYSPDDTLEMQIDRNLRMVEMQSSPTLIAGLGFRGHSGDQGLNRLNEFGVPIEGSFSPWFTGTARLAVIPVRLDANGAVSTGELGEFGANPLLAARGAPLVGSGDQTATGVGILGSYSYRDLSGQFGTSPLGFPVTNLIGNVAYTPKFFSDTLSVRLEGLRQPVTDSLLSYAGTHASLAAANALTNNAFGSNGTWGGVVKTGGRATIYYDDQSFFGAYGGAGLASLTGTNVADNSAIDALLGAYFRPWKTDDWALRVGVSLFYASFDKNLSGFTFGQGGYFSPQNYEALTFPVEYTGHARDWSWLASVALGVQHFNADSSPIFPNNPFAQTALASAAPNSAFLAGQSETGPAFNFKGQLEYQIDPTLAVGASASLDNANNYVEGIGKLYLRKTFNWFEPIAKDDPASIVARDQPANRL